MIRLLVRRWCIGLCLVAATPLFGCALAADFVNPDVFSMLGLDPLAVMPAPSRVIVAFNNDTGFEAAFLVTVSDDTADPTSNARTITATLQAGEVIANVLDCPVGVITPGTANADFTTNTVAIQITVPGDTADQATTVTYTGAPLVFGRDFGCGDVIEVRAVQIQADQTGDTQAAATFDMLVRVIPSR